MVEKRTWKVIDLLNTTADFFKQKNIENPRLNSELLLGHVLRLSRVQLYLQFERMLTENELDQIRSCVGRRSKNEPLQYILGETEFMGLTFKVNPDVLIPRPETEILCEQALTLKDKIPRASVLDIGSGSGCIAISLAHYWPQAKMWGIDKSPTAVETARENATLHASSVNERVSFWVKDVFSEWPDKDLPLNFSLILSNPPYIAQAEMNSLMAEVKDYEPVDALTDYEDGLKFYRHIMELVKTGRLCCEFLMFEMSGSQPDKIITLARQFNFENIEVSNDLNRTQRVLKIKTGERNK